MNALFIFFFFVSLLASTYYCEKSEILPLGEIISGVSSIADLASNQNSQNSASGLAEGAPKINLKIVPSKKIRITKDDMNFLLSELRQEINRQINMLEDELDEKERMRQRNSSIWSLNESPIYVPDATESADIIESEVLPEEEKAEVDELINSISEIAENENNIKENRTYNIEIRDNTTPEENILDSTSNFRQRSLRNGPIQQ